MILVDDLINNGYTLDRQLKVLEEAKQKTVAFFTVLRFRPPEAYQKYKEAEIKIDGLFGLGEFTETLGTKLLLPNDPVPKENFTIQWYFKASGAMLEKVIPKVGLTFDQNQVYLAGDRGIPFALDRRTHEVVWQHRIGFGLWATKRDKQTFGTHFS